MHKDSEMVNLRSVIETLCYMVDDDSDGVEEVMQLPTIDLVRCKDCIHFDGFYCNRFGEPAEYSSPYSDDGNDFCSFGERKESE